MQKKSPFPLLIKSGSVITKIYEVKNRDNVMFTLTYHEGGQRRIRQFGTLEKAKQEARLIAELLSQGRGVAIELSGVDRDNYLYAVRKLKPFDVTLPMAIDIFVAAKETGAPIVEACKNYAETHNEELPDKTVQQVYVDMLAAKKIDGASDAYLLDLKKRLSRFAGDFQCPIQEVTTTLIDGWLRGLKLSPRSRNNFRNSIISLFNFAKAANYLNRERATAADMTARARDKGGAIGFFTPDEFSRLLKHSDDVVLPLFILGGFCGLRTVEVLRLQWEDIHWSDQNIIISADVSKGGEARRRRIAPLTPVAAAWLKTLKITKGPVIGIDQPDERVRTICEKAKVSWKHNALRHSFITYRVAELKDFIRVAFEAGNSPQVIRSNYDAIATSQEATKWFSLMPSTPANVIRLQGANR